MGAFLGYLRKNWANFALAGIILISGLLMFFSSKSDSLVVDEKVHISAGVLHVWKGDYTFNTEHPPLLNDLAGLFAKFAKPNIVSRPQNYDPTNQWDYGDLFFYQSGNDVDTIILWARLPFILMTLGLIYLCFLWGRVLFGKKAGLLAAILVGFCPNILAHGHLATTDIGMVFTFVLAMWLLRKYYFNPNWKRAVLLGLGVGLAILAKFSGIFVMPVIFLGLIFLWIEAVSKKRKALPLLGQFALIILIPVVLIWLLYAFSMRDYLNHLPPVYEMAEFFGKKTLTQPWVKWVLVPFNKYIEGYQMVSDHNVSGHWAYLNGVISPDGWWYYFPLVLLYKVAIPALIMIFAGLVLFFRKNKGFIEEYFVIFPALLFMAIAMSSRIDIGIRHILVVLPFFFIFTSRIANFRNFYLKTGVWFLALAQIAVGVLAFPNYISYFNQIAGGPKKGIHHLADSNLDWNQNMKRFAQYAKENNINKVYELCWDGLSFEHYGISQEILPNSKVQGVVVICAEQMVVTPDGFDISWATNPAAGGRPADMIIGNAMYVWRYDQRP